MNAMLETERVEEMLKRALNESVASVALSRGLGREEREKVRALTEGLIRTFMASAIATSMVNDLGSGVLMITVMETIANWNAKLDKNYAGSAEEEGLN